MATGNKRSHDRFEQIVFLGAVALIFTLFSLSQPCLGKASHESSSQEAPHKSEEWLQKFRDDPLIPLTAILALANIGLVVYTARLSQGADETAKRQLRAYISLQVKTFETFAQTKARVSFEITNAGLTPAYDLTNTSRLMICPFPLPATFQFPTLGHPSTKTVLTPRSFRDGHAENFDPFTPEEIAGISPNNRIYIFTRVNYIDAFDTPRMAQLCMSMLGNPFLPGTQMSFQDSDKFNTST